MSKNFQRFEALPDEKQKAIMNSAMEEFVKGGYDKASVNNIVEKAAISKGSLFYYFKSKKKLYLYLFEHCENMIISNAKAHLSKDNFDFIKRMNETMKGNLKLLKDYPLVYRFVRSCKLETSIEVLNEIIDIKENTNDEILGDVYRNVDTKLFKEDIDVQKAMFTVKSTLFQLMHDFLRSGTEDQNLVESEIDQYMAFFKLAFYKPEGKS